LGCDHINALYKFTITIRAYSSKLIDLKCSKIVAIAVCPGLPGNSLCLSQAPSEPGERKGVEEEWKKGEGRRAEAAIGECSVIGFASFSYRILCHKLFFAKWFKTNERTTDCQVCQDYFYFDQTTCSVKLPRGREHFDLKSIPISRRFHLQVGHIVPDITYRV